MNFKHAIEASMKPLTEDIAALCRINSVEGEAKPGMPFGEGVAEALDAALKLGDKFGFKTENFDNYVGHIEFGEGEEIVGILGHVDVVPAGDGWDCDPWGGVITEDAIIGRGTLDDKGPLVTCLYAMKILKDLQVPLSRRIRIILGTNEETDWKCMQYYLNEVKPQLPTMAFSPDSEFPLTYAEMGLLQYTLKRPLTENIEISGGSAFNSVPSSAKVVLAETLESDVRKAISESPEAASYEVKAEDGKLILSAKGVGAHAAHLYDGKNAISLLMDLLGCLPLAGELKEVVDFYNAHFGMCLYGEKMGVACQDEDCGPLTLNVGKIMAENGQLVLCCDSRIPVSFTIESIAQKVQEKIAGTGYIYETVSTERPLYVSRDSELVKTLMDAYSKVTGDFESQPQSSGGATYSRAIDNCVAFGCLLPDQEDTMHQANERLEISKLKIWLEIMVEAIWQLAK